MNWSALAKPVRSGATALVSGIANAAGWLNPCKLFQPKPASKQLSFTIAFVGLAAKMAKADGVAVKVETQAFESCFYVPPEERANVQRVYQLASQDVAGFEAYAERIARMLADDPALLKDVFECLFNIAAADGVLHQGEEAFLQAVAAKFGYDEIDYQRVRSLFVHDPSSPYVVLGISPDATDDELKARRKELVRENHPDKLAASGVPQEFLVLADRKLAAINAAYDAILKERETRSREKASG
ncbi:MAG: TerB family tellurite resistance protein [Alphaproteobacteria bacterium]|nr:TerB family tellurite resistance protein [Alphaproteobacteria bacterium]